jgi:hypothetical protein
MTDRRITNRGSEPEDFDQGPYVCPGYETVEFLSNCNDMRLARGAFVGLAARAVDALRAIAVGGPDAYRAPCEVLVEIARAGQAAWAAERISG